MKKLRNLSLKLKIQLIIICCIFSIAAISLLNIYFISKANQKVLSNSLSASLTYSATELSKQLQTFESMADLIFSNNIIQEQLFSYQASSSNSEKSLSCDIIYNTLYDYIYNFQNRSIHYIAFYQGGKELVSTSSYISSNLSENIIDAFSQQALNANGSTLWFTDYADSEGLFLVKEIRQIERLSHYSLGVMVINVDISQLIDSTAIFNADYEDVSYLLMDSNSTLFESETFSTYDITEIKAQLTDEYSVVSLGSENFFIVHGVVPNFHWDYVCAVSYDSIVSTIELSRNISLLILAICIMLIIISSTNIISSLTKHFDFLLYKMKRFGEGSYKPANSKHDYSQRHDEIGTLHTNFDLMTEKVDKLILENYVNELHKKEAQIKALESQIDPHFLYNTLDAINWRAKAIGATDISQITMSLGNLLRISLNKRDDNYTLEMELQALNNYITIQKLRHQNRLKYRIDIPESLLNYELPKLTLQPLVENSIRYGLEAMSETCFISIQASETDEHLIFEVKNNGSSFQDDLLKKLDSEEIRPNGFGIGLLNIHKRIQMTYGSEYGLVLSNLEDEENDQEYAITRVILPRV